MQPQMKQPEPQKPVAPPPKAQPRGKSHYYMVISDEHERRAAQSWLDECFGEDNDARLVTELKIDRLHDESSVSVLVHKPINKKNKLSNSVLLVADAQGIKESVERTGEDLAKEVVECSVIKCADYWIDGSADDTEGELDVSKFLEDLGKTCMPATVKWRGDSRTLRFGWA